MPVLTATIYHVSPTGNNLNDGGEASTLQTISAAAALALPGDTITVHEGVYRERINPPRGGRSDEERITYQAAPGETVVIKGSERATGWVPVEEDTWLLTLPNSYFGHFNPYNDVIHGDWYEADQPYHTGAVYANGHWLREAALRHEVIRSEAPDEAKLTDRKLVNFKGFFLNNAQNLIASPQLVDTSRPLETQSLGEAGTYLEDVRDGDWLAFGVVDCGELTRFISVMIASPVSMSTIEIRLDHADGELVGVSHAGITAEWTHFQPFRARLTKHLAGKQRLVLVFRVREQPRDESVTDIGCWFAKVDATHTRIWARFVDVDPNRDLVEINVRQSVFYPQETGRDYITVRGFTLEHAATPWAPPTAKQIGLIGTHWSKGWIIENNTIRYATCTGVSLGKYGDEHDNTYEFPKAIERAIERGWSRDSIGGHVVRNNHISHCGQCGINGSLGSAFATITGNTIHDIRKNNYYKGCETAGIKLHGAVDALISQNHIYRCEHWGGIWLDWMAQGARVSRNLMHDNSQDLMFEVNHGPHLVDHNILLSDCTVTEASGGGAFVHNLSAGSVTIWSHIANRFTPYFRPHSVDKVGDSNVAQDDDRFYNNIFLGGNGTSAYDEHDYAIAAAGNVFLRSARPSRRENHSITAPDHAPAVELTEQADGSWWLSLTIDPSWQDQAQRQVITSEILGRAVVPGARFEQRDGSPYRLDSDYAGDLHNTTHPAPGPFSAGRGGNLRIKVWPHD